MLKRSFPWLCAVAIFLGPLHVAFVTLVSPEVSRHMSVAEKMRETAPMCAAIPSVIQAQTIPVALAPSVRGVMTIPFLTRTVVKTTDGTWHAQLLPASNRIRAPDTA
jgi:hypothetical protein